jgi:hypothetical protein
MSDSSGSKLTEKVIVGLSVDAKNSVELEAILQTTENPLSSMRVMFFPVAYRKHHLHWVKFFCWGYHPLHSAQNEKL